MKRKYEVVGPHAVAGHEPGEKFESDPLPLEGALVEGGHIRIVSQEKVACEACDKARPPKFDTYDELAEHFASDHPGLVAPTGKE
jgi:hypothetical protein